MDTRRSLTGLAPRFSIPLPIEGGIDFRSEQMKLAARNFNDPVSYNRGKGISTYESTLESRWSRDDLRNCKFDPRRNFDNIKNSAE